MVYGLIYLSQESVAFDNNELVELGAKANSRNQLLGITGLLTYKSGTFIQYIEGSKAALHELFEIIKKDQRHEITSFFEFEKIDERLFPDWAMRYYSYNQWIEIRCEDIVNEILSTMSVNVYGKDLIGKMLLSNMKTIARHARTGS